VEPPATEESFQMQEHMKITWHEVWIIGGMIEVFPAKCDEILHCGSSAWAGIVTKLHNTLTKHAMFHFVLIRKHLWQPASTQLLKMKFFRQFREEVTVKFVENAGK
jgi:hypothetical protein